MIVRRHMTINIEGALRNKKILNCFTDDNEKPMHPADVRKYLKQCLKEGKRVIPLSGEPCEGFDYQTGCPGHVISD